MKSNFFRKVKIIQPTFEKATLRRSRSTPRIGETLDSGGLPINTWGQPTCWWLKGWLLRDYKVNLIHIVCCNMMRSFLLMLFNICHGKVGAINSPATKDSPSRPIRANRRCKIPQSSKSVGCQPEWSDDTWRKRQKPRLLLIRFNSSQIQKTNSPPCQLKEFYLLRS